LRTCLKKTKQNKRQNEKLIQKQPVFLPCSFFTKSKSCDYTKLQIKLGNLVPNQEKENQGQKEKLRISWCHKGQVSNTLLLEKMETEDHCFSQLPVVVTNT
jgi:hypothetical protein